MEKTSGSQRPLSERGKDQNYDLRQKPAPLKDSGKHPCGVCRKRIGSNSIFCDVCQSWIYKKYISFKDRLKADPKYDAKDVWGFADRWMVDLKRM